MTISSATIIRDETQIIHSDIGVYDSDAWIQESAIRHTLEKSNRIINNIYAQVIPAELSFPVSSNLKQEFITWDMMSDDALLNFERELL